MQNYSSGRAVVLAILLFGAGLAVVAWLKGPRISLRIQSPAEKPTVAVLPFRNLNGEPDLEVIASDLTAAVAEAVGETGRASTVPREDTLGIELDRKGIEEAARTLHADYIIAGSVNEVDGRLEVDGYLFRSGAAPALWAERLHWDASRQSAAPSELAARIKEAILSAR